MGANASYIQNVPVLEDQSPNAGDFLLYSQDPVGGGPLAWRSTAAPPKVEVAQSNPSSDGGLSSAGVTVAGWLEVNIGGTVYKMPYFQ